jgi:heat shock protein HspQ
MVGIGGEGGIRTLGELAPTPHFECGAFDHSATSPQKDRLLPVPVERRALANEIRFAKRGARHFSCAIASPPYIGAMTNTNPPVIGANIVLDAPFVAHARFSIGDVVKHLMFGFRGVVFDIDPVFANSEEWYEAIPEDMRPDRNQPFYHLLAENGEASYIAYVSQQNLVMDDSDEPVEHPAISGLFSAYADGRYSLRPVHRH